jgi:hypothetical protein
MRDGGTRRLQHQEPIYDEVGMHGKACARRLHRQEPTSDEVGMKCFRGVERENLTQTRRRLPPGPSLCLSSSRKKPEQERER